MIFDSRESNMKPLNWSDATVERPLNLRKRPDLSISPLSGEDRTDWVVKDPLALNYVLLRDEEYTVLNLLDGQTSLHQIRQQFERKFFPLELTSIRLQEFLATLNRQNLLVVDSEGQGEQLLQRRSERTRKERLSRWTNVLAIRFRGFNPERLFEWLHPQFRWIYSWPFMTAYVLIVVAASILLALQFSSLRLQLAELDLLSTPTNLLWLAVTLAAAKIIHEFAHGLTCRHFGGSCHEIGLMLLVFTPCLYCNVSDAWSFPNRWHRIAVSAAGILAEVFLASLCLLVWWFSEPGLLNSLCLNMVVVCGVSTLLLNGNPFLRYDGYYVLSDLLRVPNLREQSTEVVQSYLARWFLGISLLPETRLAVRRRGQLAAYWIASTAYRWFILIAILWMVNLAAKQFKIEIAARLLTCFVVLSLLSFGCLKAYNFYKKRFREIRHFRAAIFVGLFCSLAMGLLLMPMQRQIEVPAVVQPTNVEPIFIVVPGHLVDSVALGSRVERGETLARLRNLDLQLEIRTLIGQRKLQEHHLQNLELRSLRDDHAAADIAPAKEVLSKIEQRLAEKKADLDRLTIRAPIDGLVMPVNFQRMARDEEGQLTPWHGNPLEKRNSGAYLEVGTTLCRIGNPDEMDALLTIDQTQMQHLAVGQRVSVLLYELRERVLMGTITEISQAEISLLEKQNAAVSPKDRSSDNGLSEVTYRARVKFDVKLKGLLSGAGGRAKVHVEAAPLGERLYEHLSRTFRFSF